ncbi:MAG TPA: hypothetical protein VK804_18360 [Bradyrhizobium sp.]|uniref:hypothetical protein n=1 Tax=Bradyrhizobium sp. TaxID=376 RepID=UPI002CD41185|nr:hypothetical protein [Bradyrhizobium sp.]HTB02433.1 hypothetical protein [Bradyrhizobium sp.]
MKDNRAGVALGTMWGLARLAALALAGCVTTAENSLSQNDIASMKLTGITVSFAPDAGVQWEDGIRAYATAKAISDDQIATATNTPEGNAYVRTMLAPVIQTGVSKSMAGQLVGSRPVRLDVVVKSFALSSAVQRILIGGGRGMVADANLVDARTGAIIIAYPNLVAASYAGQGIVGTAVQAAIDSSSDQSVAEKLASRYGNIYRNWLLRQS